MGSISSALDEYLLFAQYLLSIFSAIAQH